jgi:hypothetical protein
MALEVSAKHWPTLCTVAQGWLLDVPDGNEKIVGLIQ